MANPIKNERVFLYHRKLAEVVYATCQEWLLGCNQPDSVFDRIAAALAAEGVVDPMLHETLDMVYKAAEAEVDRLQAFFDDAVTSRERWKANAELWRSELEELEQKQGEKRMNGVQQKTPARRPRHEQELLDAARHLVGELGQECHGCGCSTQLPKYHYVYSHAEGCVVGRLADAVAGYDGYGDDDD